MRKMEKIISILLVCVLAICSFYSFSYADDAKEDSETDKEKTFTCELKQSATEVTVGDEFTVTFALKSTSGLEIGISGIVAEMSYDDDILEYVEKTALNNWNVSFAESSKMVSVYNDESFISATNIFTMKFKVKDTTKESATIDLKNVIGSEDDVDINSSDISATIKIAKKQEETKTPTTTENTENAGTTQTENPSTDTTPATSGSSTQGTENNGTSTATKDDTTSTAGKTLTTSNSEKTETKTPTEHAALGIADSIFIIGGMLILAGVSIISIIKYVHYKKY